MEEGAGLRRTVELRTTGRIPFGSDRTVHVDRLQWEWNTRSRRTAGQTWERSSPSRRKRRSSVRYFFRRISFSSRRRFPDEIDIIAANARCIGMHTGT